MMIHPFIEAVQRIFHRRPTAETSTHLFLRQLQQLCARLPEGQAELAVTQGQLNLCLLWNAASQGEPSLSEGKSQPGWVLQINGNNRQLMYAETEFVQTCPCGKEVLSNTGVPGFSDKEICSRKAVDNQPFEDRKPAGKSRVQQTVGALRSYMQLRYAFRYNRLTDCTECAARTDDGHILPYRPVDQRLLNSISMTAMEQGIDCWDRDVKRLVESADVPAYHPFAAYLQNLPKWDGKDRVAALAARVTDSDYWLRHFHRWMLCATAQWMNLGNPGKRANAVAPILISARQGLGKSSFCRNLLPPCLQNYFTESFDLNNPASAEGKLAAYGLINLDEFDRLSARRMPQLKNLMQMERLNIRRAYKHSAEPLHRIANFIGTSNRRDLLTDLSGSRRFICIEVEHPIDCTTPIEYDQLYAQLKAELEAGARAWFSKEEEAEIQRANRIFYRVSPAEELLEGSFVFTEPGAEGAHILSAAEIYAVVQKKHPQALRDCTPMMFSRMLSQLGRRVHTRYGNGYWVKAQ